MAIRNPPTTPPPTDPAPTRRARHDGPPPPEQTGDLPAFLVAIFCVLAVIAAVVAGAAGLTRPWFGLSFAGSDTESAERDEASSSRRADDTLGHDLARPDEEQGGLGEGAISSLSDALAASGRPGLALSAEGTRLTISGVVANEAERREVVAMASATPGVSEVVDRLALAGQGGAEVSVFASQAAVVLEGTVPDQVLADELVTRMADVYLPDQIVDRLTVVAGKLAPVQIVIEGSVTDAALHRWLETALSGIVGVDPTQTDGLVLGQPGELETALDELEPIQFASGSAVILSESATTLDRAAQLLTTDPDAVVEVGAHAADDASAQANEALSQDRATAVASELAARGVTNPLVARGYGERRLAPPASDGAPTEVVGDQEVARVVELRVIG